MTGACPASEVARQGYERADGRRASSCRVMNKIMLIRALTPRALLMPMLACASGRDGRKKRRLSRRRFFDFGLSRL